MGIERTIIALAISALALIMLTVLRVSQLTRASERARKPGIIRVLFLSWLSLKLWVALILIYILINTFWPLLLGPSNSDPPRLWIRLVLAAYLVFHPVSVLIALERWRDPGRLARWRRRLRGVA